MPAIFNKEQEEAITHKEGPLMVLAGPGSGKTLVITYRVKWLIENAGVHWYFSLNFLYDSSLCIPIYGRKYYP